MTTGQLPAALEHLRKLVAGCAGDASDAELLARFSAGREEDAFTALLRRHGRMVWGVCRHVLRHEQDAEDAFQATFLVLARKAGSIRKSTAVASFLHGTAYHIATRARRDAAVRRVHERKGKTMPGAEPVAEAAWREVLAILDEEVQRLPARQRAAFVLCALEGKSLADAARQLGWKEGTVSGTLSRAREQLRRRLARRGVTLSAVLTGLALSPDWAQSAAPPVLAERTLRAALAVGESAAGMVPAPVASLVRAATRPLAVTKLRLAAFVLASAAFVAGVGGLTRQEPDAKPEAGERPGAHAADQPKSKDDEQRHTDRYGDPLPPGAVARMGTVRLRGGGYRGGGSAVFSADGKTLISAGANGLIHHWDVATGKPLRRFRTISWAAGDVKFSPDRKLVAVVAIFEPKTIGLWETATGKLVRRLDVPAGGRAVRLAFSPDGKTLVSGGGSDNKVCFWDVSSGRLLRQLPVKAAVCVLDFTPDGRTLVSKSPGWVHLWDPATGEEIRRFQVNTNITLDYAFSPDGKTLAAGRGGAIELREVATGKELGRLQAHGGVVNAVAFSPDGKTLASGGSSTIQFWDAITHKEIARGDASARWIFALTFSPDGKTLASRGSDTSLRLWDVATGRELQRRAGHRTAVFGVLFAPDGTTLATHAQDSAVCLWRAGTGEQLQVLPADPDNPAIDAAGMLFTPDGKGLIVADRAGTLRVRAPANGRELRRFSLQRDRRREETYLAGLALSPDGKTLTALASQGFWEGDLARPKWSVLTLAWDLATGEPIRRRQDAAPAMESWALSADGKLRASYNRGPLLGVRAVGTGEEVVRLNGQCEGVWPVAFSPDGRLLAGVCHHGRAKGEGDAYSSSLAVWELATGGEVRRFRLKPGSPEIALAFSSDGRVLASGGDPSVGLRLWDLTTGEELHRYGDAGAAVRSLAFDRAGRRLASGLADGTALVWDAGEPLRRAGPHPKDLSGRDLDRLWSDLAADAAKGHAALWTLAGGREKAVAFLTERLRPAKAEDPERIRRLIAELDSDQFAVREAAARSLETLGSQAEPALRKALEAKPSAELRKRVEALLAGPKTARSPGVVRQVRAVRVLEWVGSQEARRHLETLAGGAPAARLTQEAKASLQRLNSSSLRR